MTPMPDVLMVDAERILNGKLCRELATSMFSRVPVYSGKRSNIIGMLLVHDVLAAAAGMIPDNATGEGAGAGADADAGDEDEDGRGGTANVSISRISVRSCMYQIGSLPRFSKNTTLTKVLQAFKSGAPNMGLVYDQDDDTSGVVGIFTMSTLMEHVLKSRVPDEKYVTRHTSQSRSLFYFIFLFFLHVFYVGEVDTYVLMCECPPCHTLAGHVLDLITSLIGRREEQLADTPNQNGGTNKGLQAN